jgi:hypothetical protein
VQVVAGSNPVAPINRENGPPVSQKVLEGHLS